MKGIPALPGGECKTKPLNSWTKQEKWVWEKTCKGEPANFNKEPGYGGDLDPKDGTLWTEDNKNAKNRILSSEFLETILLHEPFRGALTRRGVLIIGAWFREKVDLVNADLERELWLDKSRFDADVDITGLKTSDIISLEGSSFNGKLNMDKLNVASSLLMRGGAEFEEVVLIGAKVGGQLDMDGSTFKGKLDMDSLQVSGSLFMRNGAEFFKEVVLIGAKVAGQLAMDSSKFKGEFNMESMEVGSHLYLSNSEIEKPVNLYASTIGGDLDILSTPEEKKLPSIDLTNTEIKGELRLGSSRHKPAQWSDGSRLTLRNTKVTALQELENSWPDELELVGFTYSRLGGLFAGEGKSMADRPASWLIEWLEKQDPYSPQPYEQLAKVLMESGHKESANEILFASKEREREGAPWFIGKHPWINLSRLALDLQYIFVGHGFRLRYTLLWIYALTFSGVFVLALFGQEKLTGAGEAIAYSLDMLLPIIRLEHTYYTEISFSGITSAYFYFQQVMGYVLASFLVAGISGITKK